LARSPATNARSIAQKRRRTYERQAHQLNQDIAALPPSNGASVAQQHQEGPWTGNTSERTFKSQHPNLLVAACFCLGLPGPCVPPSQPLFNALQMIRY
jgi:hypothetical protein